MFSSLNLQMMYTGDLDTFLQITIERCALVLPKFKLN